MTNTKGITFEKGSWYYCPTFDYYFCYDRDSENGVMITAKKGMWTIKPKFFETDYEITNDKFINDAEPANMNDVNKFINPE